MIIDSLKSFDKYLNIHENFPKVLDFINSNDLHKLEEGNYVIVENDVWCSIQNREAASFEEPNKLEVHDSFLDVHILLEGNETIGFRDRVKCDTAEVVYDEANDIAMMNEDPEVYVSCGVDNFLICFPTDAHAPLLGYGKIKKAVIKVRV